MFAITKFVEDLMFVIHSVFVNFVFKCQAVFENVSLANTFFKSLMVLFHVFFNTAFLKHVQKLYSGFVIGSIEDGPFCEFSYCNVT